MAKEKSPSRYVQTVAKYFNAFQREFLRAKIICCKVTLMITRFATIVKSFSFRVLLVAGMDLTCSDFAWTWIYP